jgi:hypothetical protein
MKTQRIGIGVQCKYLLIAAPGMIRPEAISHLQCIPILLAVACTQMLSLTLWCPVTGATLVYTSPFHRLASEHT